MEAMNVKLGIKAFIEDGFVWRWFLKIFWVCTSGLYRNMIYSVSASLNNHDEYNSIFGDYCKSRRLNYDVNSKSKRKCINCNKTIPLFFIVRGLQPFMQTKMYQQFLPKTIHKTWLHKPQQTCWVVCCKMNFNDYCKITHSNHY